MAVRESLRNMQDLQAASLKLKKQKEAERIKAKEKKEIQERIKKEIEIFLHSEFSENLQRYGSNYVIEYYNINKKNALLGSIWSNHIMEKEIILNNKIKYNTKIIQYKEFIQDYFNKIYYKILKQEEEIQKKNEIYIYYNTLQQQLQQQPQQQPQQQQQQQPQQNINISKINKIINTIIIILLAIICFPIAILFAACKKQK